MENLITKEVNFDGDNLIAIQNKETGKIYTGISYVCRGIGLTKSQKDTQVQNVQSDLILKMGCLKLQAGVLDPDNEVIVIEIDYLPLWLAKISITPKMQKDSPKTVERLIKYQLKAKDALAEAFLKNNELMQLQNQIKQMIKNEVSKALSETAANEMEKVEEKCSEFYRPTHFTKYNISKYIKQRLGITKANEEYELVKQRIFIILQASKWEDIPMEVLSNSMHIVDESIDVIKKDRPYSQVSMFDYRQMPRARM